MVQNNHNVNTAWLGVISLAFAAFVFNTTEFIPIALLSDIGRDFGMTAAKTGMMITIYAWVVALASLPLLLMVGNVERKRLLLMIFIVFIISHIICFLADSFVILMIGRVGIAIAHAIFWSITAALAVRVAPVGRRAQALGIIATGSALATVLGIPIGRLIGQSIGWRYTFLSIGILALIILVILMKVLPRLPSQNAGSIKSLPIIFKRPTLVGIFILTAICVTANFTAYSYIEPFATEIAKISSNYTTLLLLIFGGAGIVGSVLFSKFSAKHPLSFLPISIILLMLCTLLLLPIAGLPILLFILAFFWGIASMCILLALQVKVLDLASDATDVSMSIFSGIFNIGIGAGALVGNVVITKASLESIGWFGACISMSALALALFLFTKYKAQFLEAAKPKDIVAH